MARHRGVYTPPKYKKGTPIKDRVEPRLQELGYDTSTLKVVRFNGGGPYYDIALNDFIAGEYNQLHDELVMHRTPEEIKNDSE